MSLAQRPAPSTICSSSSSRCSTNCGLQWGSGEQRSAAATGDGLRFLHLHKAACAHRNTRALNCTHLHLHLYAGTEARACTGHGWLA